MKKQYIAIDQYGQTAMQTIYKFVNYCRRQKASPRPSKFYRFFARWSDGYKA